MNKNSLNKILIIQTAFIGDVTLATSIVEKLKEFYPETKIDFLLRKGNEILLKNNPKINQVLIFDKTRNKNLNLLKIISKVRKEKYDYVINVQRFFTTGMITFLSGGKMKVGFDKNPWSKLFNRAVEHVIDPNLGIHEIDRNQQLISDITNQQPAMPVLYPGTEEYNKVEPYKEKDYICIAPTSVWFTKQFPLTKWAEFITQLDDNLQIYLLGSKEDKKTCKALVNKSSHPQIEIIAGELNLLESAALMKDAQMNYVNDSAPLHLASAVNAPVCAVFCSTVPGFGFGPLSEKSFVVEISELLPCRPCGLHGFKKCPLDHFKCSEIDVRKLLAVLNNSQ